MEKNELLLAYYGDDLTGSTDALEFLSRAGIKTILFLEPPSKEQLSRYSDIGAVGIAGMSRSLSPGQMEKELRPAFEALRETGARHVHYKVCSTFDSSPEIGSIGKAIDIGAEVFPGSFIPLLVAAPTLGRHCVFGNLFARMGIGSTGEIYRLDRHPSMSCHPITPARESDLRLHLSQQTTKKIGLFDILKVPLSEKDAINSLEEIVKEGAQVVLFDALYQEQLERIGQVIDSCVEEQQPLFSVGSSGIEMALGAHWFRKGILPAPERWEHPGSAEPLLVASGSCSPVTAKQIEQAISLGFREIALNTAGLLKSGNLSSALESYVAKAVKTFSEGKSIILHTSRGGDDPRVKESKEIFSQKRISESSAEIYGTALGEILRKIAERIQVKRIVLAGGDTSSFAARAMGIEAVEMLAPVSPGAPLCKAHATGSAVDGLEVNFKGGQVGSRDYFERLRDGNAVRAEKE